MNKIQEQDVEVVLDTTALRVNQFGRELYQFSLPASKVSELIVSKQMNIDRWSPDHQDGYQRVPTESRYKKFGKYVATTKGISPISILLSIRDPKKLDVKEAGKGLVHLRIMSGATLYIPDGQHRAYGLAWAVDQYPGECEAYEIPVVLFVANGDDPKYEEAQQFYTINQNSKRVRTDLAQRYILRSREKELGEIEEETMIPQGTMKEVEPYAVKIADMLNAGGPLEGKIEAPNMTTAESSITQTSFVESIRPLLVTASKLHWTVGKTKSMIAAYWNAIKYKCPESSTHWTEDGCDKDNEEHFDAVLMTTTGVFSLNDVLERTLWLPEVASTPTSPETFKKLLSKPALEEFFSDGAEGFWGSKSSQDNSASSHGTSRKSFKEIADEVWEAIMGA